MTYILEDQKEFQRLEKQSTPKDYSLESELEYLVVDDNKTLLDAGCGSGVLLRYLREHYRNRNLTLVGCDQSELRLQQAKKVCGKHDIKFQQTELHNISFQESTFDIVTCRYVYEYFTDPFQVSNEFFRILKSNGVLYLIDFDGIFFNFFTSNKILNNDLEFLHKKIGIDLFVGRKLPIFLKMSGFKNINWKITTHTFSGDELFKEHQNMHQRLETIYPVLVDIFGSNIRAENFVESYLREMTNEENTLFYNKIIAWGQR